MLTGGIEGFTLTSGPSGPLCLQALDLTTMWYSVDRWNTGFSERCSLLARFESDLRVGTVHDMLTGGIEGFTVTSGSCSVLARFKSDHRVVQLSLIHI